MLRVNDETTDQDALHFAIEREWKQDRVQRDFWRDQGYCKFYVYIPPDPLFMTVNVMPDDIGPQPAAFAQLDRVRGIIITTPLDQSYKWIIPVRFNTFGMIKTLLINPANRGRY